MKQGKKVLLLSTLLATGMFFLGQGYSNVALIGVGIVAILLVNTTENIDKE